MPLTTVALTAGEAVSELDPALSRGFDPGKRSTPRYASKTFSLPLRTIDHERPTYRIARLRAVSCDLVLLA